MVSVPKLLVVPVLALLVSVQLAEVSTKAALAACVIVVSVLMAVRNCGTPERVVAIVVGPIAWLVQPLSPVKVKVPASPVVVSFKVSLGKRLAEMRQVISAPATTKLAGTVVRFCAKALLMKVPKGLRALVIVEFA